MIRYRKEIGKFVENKRIDAFLEDIISVCKKYHLSISHEDTNGAFRMEEYSNENIEWIKNASDYTKRSLEEALLICNCCGKLLDVGERIVCEKCYKK